MQVSWRPFEPLGLPLLLVFDSQVCRPGVGFNVVSLLDHSCDTDQEENTDEAFSPTGTTTV